MVTMKKTFFPTTWSNLRKQYLNLNPGFALTEIKATYRWIQ
jgi:hypothetical protein